MCHVGDPLQLTCTAESVQFMRWNVLQSNEQGILDEVANVQINARDINVQMSQREVDSATLTFMRTSAQFDTPFRGGSRTSNKGGAKVNICARSARENFGHAPFLRNHAHLIAAKRGNNQKTWKNQWKSSFCLYRQVYQSYFIAKCMLDRGF